MSAIKLASDSLIVTPAGGNIEYNGQFFATDSNNARAQLGRLVLETAKASTSGTSIDFTGIPAWAKRITVMFNGVSTSGTSNILIQIGSGSITNTGYLGAGITFVSTPAAVNSTAGFIMTQTVTATTTLHGLITICALNSTSYSASGILSNSNGAQAHNGSGSVTLSATLDRIRITTVNGTDTFDAGSINILIEG